MRTIRDPAVLARMRVTFDLNETAEAMMRQNLRRRYPQATEVEIERLLVDWLHRQPGPPPGRPSRRFGSAE
jgi:hypothetical protein